MNEEVIGVIVVLLVTLVAIYIIVKNFGGMIRLLVHSMLPLSSADRIVLASKPYYAALGKHDKREFEKRVKEVLYEKEWQGQGIAVTREMKLRIASALVQLTFGLERILLLHFQRIVIHPAEFKDRKTGNRHQGDVRPGRRTINLSWKHFELGYADPHDGRNLGLHEMAHALWLENRIANQEHDFLDRELLQAWDREAEAQIRSIRRGTEHLFRKYAATNTAEFFAVAVENFFEQPGAFARELPALYSILQRLLRQDPAHIMTGTS
jgi:MtfA peptidase